MSNWKSVVVAAFACHDIEEIANGPEGESNNKHGGVSSFLRINNSACSRIEVAMGVLGDVKADNGVDDGLHRCEGVFGVLSEDELHA